MEKPNFLEHAVLLGAAGLLLAVALLTVIHLDAWSWIKENLGRCRISYRGLKRTDKREKRRLRQHQEGSIRPLSQQPATGQEKLSFKEGDKESVFTGSDHLPQQLYPRLKKSLSPAPCRW